MAYLNHNIPPVRCFIRNEYLFNHTKGHGEYTECQVHAVASIEGRVPLFEALLDNGVNWTRRPITAFCWKKGAPVHNLKRHMYWNSFSPYVDVQCRQRLAGLAAELVDFQGKKEWGEYLFTLDWSWENKAGVLDVNFSEDHEHKCAHFFKMDDGNFFAYPNNRIIWQDDCWTTCRIKENPGYLIDENLYAVEALRRDTVTDDKFVTNFDLAD